MIPDLKLKVERENWQKELKNAFTNVDDLLTYLKLDKTKLSVDDNPYFKLRVPKAYANKMQKGCYHDPLLKQVLPLKEESKLTFGFSPDPLQESKANPLPGVLHKFPSRVLLITGQSCAVHCRYCFRQHFPYEDNRINKAQWQQAFEYIQKNPEIYEVILSGGDPLNLNDAMLKWFIDNIQSIETVKLLRIHTRTGLVLPSRITENLANILGAADLQVTMVFHANHPNEIGMDVIEGASRLKHKNITLLNQSVLLKGVNDDGETLVSLSKALFEAGILPYYLHHLDAVQGSAHFEVDSKIESIIHHLHTQLPGFLVPRFVKEIPGKPYKVPMDLSYLSS